MPTSLFSVQFFFLLLELLYETGQVVDHNHFPQPHLNWYS